MPKRLYFGFRNIIDNNKDVVQNAVDKRHLICNHSYCHKWKFPLLSSSKMEEEILKTNQFIEQYTGTKSKYFRPPFGIINPTIVKVCKILGLQIIGWNIRSYDTIFSRKKAFNRIVRKIKPGAIILLHDSLNETHLLLEELFIYMKQIDYKVVRLDKMIAENKTSILRK